MYDVTIKLEDRPGSLAEMGEALGRAGVSIEGGGAWLQGSEGVGHFLFADAQAASNALQAAGITVLDQREVLVQRLSQDETGQLGKLTRRMAEAGVNILTLYSDHDNQLVLVVDDPMRGAEVSQQWRAEREAKKAARKTHHYAVSTKWTGSNRVGTKNYRSYERSYTLQADGKPVIEGSSDAAFRGDATRYNPEDLLVASLSSCHMLSYLHLCAVNGVVVLAYEDKATGTMRETPNGSANFEQVTLSPEVTVTAPAMIDKANELHHQAHELCFIARSVNFQVNVVPHAKGAGHDFPPTPAQRKEAVYPIAAG